MNVIQAIQGASPAWPDNHRLLVGAALNKAMPSATSQNQLRLLILVQDAILTKSSDWLNENRDNLIALLEKSPVQ